jgi:hypothetical protein
MARSWITSVFEKRGRRPARFAPRITLLEDRDVPATFFVDPSIATVPVGDSVTFDAGRPDAVTGPFATGADGSIYNDLAAAIGAANGLAGADTIRLAHTSSIFFVNSAADTPVAITDSVNFVGSGAGTSIIQTDPNNNQPTAVLVVQGAGVVANFSDVTFFGGAGGFDPAGTGNVLPNDSITGRFIRYEAGTSGTIDHSVIQGIFAPSFLGIGVSAVGAGTNVTVQNSMFSSIGRVGVAAGTGANINLFGNTYTGKGAGLFVDVFAQLVDGATATISGNTVTGNQGVDANNDTSAAVIVSQGGGAASTATIFGNNLAGNSSAVVVGDNAADTSMANIQFNNLSGNLAGVGTNRTATPNVNAANNFWGGVNGPLNATNNPTGTGSPVADDVTFTPIRTSAPTVLAAPDLPTYLAQVTQVSVLTVADATEPATAGTFRVSRTAGGDTSQPLTVNYTVGGTAVPGVDYTTLPGSATIPAGVLFVDVPVTPISRPGFQGTRTVVITITASPTTYTPTGGPAQINILDNESQAVGVAGTANATEPATAGNFRFTRTGDTSAALTVNFTVGGTAVAGTDYTALPTSVTFTAGQATVDVPVTPISQPGFQGTRTVTVAITPATGIAVVGASGQVDILDNETAPTPVGVSGTANATEPSTAGNFQFTRTGDTSAALTVNFTVGGTAVAGTDYTALPTSVTFTAGQATVDVPVTPISQPGFQGTRTVTVTITPATGITVVGGSAQVNIIDNESPPTPTSVGVQSTADATEPSTPGNFRFTRTGDTSAALTVNYTIGGTAVAGTDYQALSGTATFAAGSATVDVPVTPISQPGFQGTRTVTVTLTPAAGITLVGSQAQLNIIDNESPPTPTTVGVQQTANATEPSTPGNFLFTRTGDTSAALTVNYTTGGTAVAGTDYQALSGTVTFAAGSATANVPVTPISRPGFQGTRTVTATITPATGITVVGGSAQVNIIDNESPSPTLPVVSVTNTANATEPSTAGNFRFTRTGDTSAALTVNYTIAGTAVAGTDYTALPGTVTFAAGSATVDVPVTPLGSTFTTARTVIATLTAGPNFTASGGPATVTINPPPTPTTAVAPLVVTGAPNSPGQVFAPTSAGRFPTTGVSVNPFSGAGGATRSASADVNGDGTPDLIFVTGPGVPARFQVISGKDNTTVLVPPTDPFGSNFTGGAFVAAGDFNGDGRAEIVICPDQGGGPNVVIFSLNTAGSLDTPKAFFALGNPGFRGGARPAIGDVNGDGTPDLAVAAGFLGGPAVEIHDGKAIGASNFTTLIGSGFFAFPGADSQTLRNGAFIAIGDVDGDGKGDLIAGGGPGGGPRVLVLSGKFLSTGDYNSAYASPVANFFFGDPNSRGGVRVASKNVDGDNKADIVVGSGEGLPALARVFFGNSVRPVGDPTAFEDLGVFGGQVLAGGVFVG